MADGDFVWEECSVSGFAAWEKLRAWSTCQNKSHKSVEYKVGGRTLEKEVTFLNSCKLLRLHSVDPTDDPVQVQVRNNILGCGNADDPADRVRTILGGIMVVHATRHYEYSAWSGMLSGWTRQVWNALRLLHRTRMAGLTSEMMAESTASQIRFLERKHAVGRSLSLLALMDATMLRAAGVRGGLDQLPFIRACLHSHFGKDIPHFL